MSAFVVSEVTILDEKLAEEYRRIAQETIEQYGGRYLVRGAKVETAEGKWPEGRALVIVEFPDYATLKKWYCSPEYAKALKIRDRALERNLLFAEGI